MKISIITTCFNCEKYIAETLESVLSQKGSFELEYIIIDAASEDNSLRIISAHEERLKHGCYGENPSIEMKVISEKDNGMYEGITKGFQMATGEIIAYLNADDFYFPHAFEFVASILKNIHKFYGSADDNVPPTKKETLFSTDYHLNMITKGF